MRWVKPRPWNWQPHLVHPKWRWAVQDLVVMAPYWEGSGTPRVWQKNGWVNPTVGGSPGWYHTEAGVGYRSAASGDKVTVPVAGLPTAFPSDGEIYTMLAVFYYDDIKIIDESGIVSDDGTTPRFLELISTGEVRTWPGQSLVGATALSAAGLHTVATVRDGSNATVYLDGAVDAGPSAKTTTALGASNLNVSGGANQDWFDGTLLAVFIWSSVLANNQIALISANPFGLLTPVEVPIVGYVPASGSQNASVNSAAATATGYAPTAAPQSVTVGVDSASATATGFAPTPVPQAVTVGLDNAAATATGYAPTAVPQAVTVSLDSASATATGYAPTAAPQALTVAVDGTSATATGYAPTAVPQALTISVPNASAIATGLSPTTVPQPVTVAIDSASAIATGLSPTAVPQAITGSVNSASAIAVGLTPSASPQAVTIALDVATAQANGLSLTAILGNLGYPGSASASATGLSPTAVPQAVTVAIDHATAIATAYAGSAASIGFTEVYVVEPESRVYLVLGESRVYTVEEESRVRDV